MGIFSGFAGKNPQCKLKEWGRKQKRPLGRLNIIMNPHKLKTSRIAWGLLALLLVAVAAGCQNTTPPGPDVAYDTIGSTNCTLLAWKEGLRINLWYDITGNFHTSGSGSTSDPIYKESGYAQAADGRQVNWQVETADGKSATFSIAGQPYDLAKGALFLVTTRSGQTQVQQLSFDLSKLPAVHESCQTVADASPDVSSFIQTASAK